MLKIFLCLAFLTLTITPAFGFTLCNMEDPACKKAWKDHNNSCKDSQAKSEQAFKDRQKTTYIIYAFALTVFCVLVANTTKSRLRGKISRRKYIIYLLILVSVFLIPSAFALNIFLPPLHPAFCTI